MVWLGILINVAGIGAAIVAPIAVMGRCGKTAMVAGLMALGYAVMTIVGLGEEWHRHYWDLESDLFIFGVFAALTALSGIGSLAAVRRTRVVANASGKNE